MRHFFSIPHLFLICILFAVVTVSSAQEAKVQEFRKQLEVALDNDNYGKASFLSYEIAKIFVSQNNDEDAIKYFSQSAVYGNKGEEPMLVYLSYQRLGVAYMNQTNNSKALNNFQKALKVAREMGKKEFIGDGLVDVAVNYALLNRHKRSIAPLEEALALALQIENESIEKRCYELLAQYHKKLGNDNKAIEYSAMLDKLNDQKIRQQQSGEELKALAEKVEQADAEIDKTDSLLNRQSQQLRSIEDNLLAVKYSLEETEDLLKNKEDSLSMARQVSENQQLQIDLLNKDKALSDLQIKEQETRLRHAAWIRNFIILAVLLAGSLVFVLIRSYKKKIEANQEIERKNQKIRSSINYAQRIQEATLPDDNLRENLIPDSFILFKPRDAVSGDFYFISEIKSWYDPDVVMAAVDCTGHGIPGAFMSMIGMNSLNQIISQGEADSDQILVTLDKTINSALKQEATGNKDGMDVALCIYRKEKDVIEFSGAKNPLVYIQNNELFQIKGDVHPIGGFRKSNKKGEIKKTFKKHIVQIDQPTMIYLYSDGYQDQFGGEKGAKFMAKRFKNLLLDIHNKPVAEQKKILEETFDAWKGDIKQTDDILVMGIRLDNSVEAES
ncbi:SpoIIE family protein phosphatase [Fulvivirga sp. M361]|uniref:SpoIIE family protein phosphatase n=1 Tax=Fulvivirga sp. M361 TaxID=2594266 RepID=UPI00117A1889|nr:SpoIIE family protein phosphatase [Fulvivirga sp. M361]TRX52219.1 SpoIIE family protein phosphatase [Fulvivirga sp. M361]